MSALPPPASARPDHRRRRWLASAASLPTAALLGSLAPGLAIAQTEIRHASGTTTIPARPTSVLVFDLGVLDTMMALSIEPKGVPGRLPQPKFAHFAGSRYAKIGTVFEPDLEAVHAARPDLIIVAGRSQAKYGELAKIAPTIDLTVRTEAFLPDVYAHTTLLGRTFGDEAAATARIEEVKARITKLNTLGQKAGTGLIVLTTGGKMSAYGPGSRFGVLHDSFGIRPVDARLKQALHGQAVSFEFLLQQNPDWLFVIDRDAAIGRDGQSAQRLLDNPLVRQTTAWKSGQLVHLDPINWYSLGSAGIGALKANVDQLVAALEAARG